MYANFKGHASLLDTDLTRDITESRKQAVIRGKLSLQADVGTHIISTQLNTLYASLTFSQDDNFEFRNRLAFSTGSGHSEPA